MIRAHCRRALKHPAARVGRLLFGPVCARRLGLLAPPPVRHAVCDAQSRAERDGLICATRHPKREARKAMRWAA